MRERERERECVCVCVRERERERVCVCVSVRGSVSVVAHEEPLQAAHGFGVVGRADQVRGREGER